jgi:hypothetical protein
MLEAATADRWCRLLRDGLGYERFGAHGSDVGAGVTIQLGRRHPGQLVGIHLSAFYLEPPPPGSRVQVPSGFAVFADSYRPGSARPPREHRSGPGPGSSAADDLRSGRAVLRAGGGSWRG